jgi:hypothetical protein
MKSTPALMASSTEWKKVTLPWYAGSEYRCKICRLLFFYNQVHG